MFEAKVHLSLAKAKQRRVHTSAEDSRMYTCGSELFPPHYNSIVMCAALLCVDQIELQYYSATFPEVCFFCGLDEGLINDDSIKELHKQFAIVRPICFFMSCLVGNVLQPGNQTA